MKHALFFAYFLCTFFMGIAQSWTDLSKKVKDLYDKGKYEEAIPIAKNAIDSAKKEFGETDSKYIKSLYNLGELFMNMAQFEKAEPIYLEAIAIRKKTVGENHPDYAESLQRLSRSYMYTGKFDKAEPLFLQAKEILRRNHGDNDSL